MNARASFGADTTSAAEARHFTERTLAAWGHQDLLETARLLVSELVVNAVLHAGSESVLALKTDDTHLRVEVYDRSREAPALQTYDPLAASGRGLMIMDALAEQWGVEVGPNGKVVWFELPLGSTSASVEARQGSAGGDGR